MRFRCSIELKEFYSNKYSLTLRQKLDSFNSELWELYSFFSHLSSVFRAFSPADFLILRKRGMKGASRGQ